MFISPSDLNIVFMAKKSMVSTALDTINRESGKKGTGLSFGSSADPMYDRLYKANPYVNMTYNKSPWQSFLSGLGFRTDYDRWLEEAQVNANEYDAQVASVEQQNQYNSPQAEAQRMKQAGMNPDLVGLENVAESASPNVDPQGMSPGAGESGEFGEVTQKLWNFGTGILSLYQVGLGLAKDLMSYKQMKNAVDGQDIGLAKDFMDFANDIVLQNSPDRPFDDDTQYHNHRVLIAEKFAEVPKALHLNRRQRKIWNNVTGQDYFNSENFKRLTENWKQSAGNLDTLSKTPQFLKATREEDDPSFNEWKTFSIVSDNLGKLARDVWKMQQNNYKDVANAGSALAKYQKRVTDARANWRSPQDGSDMPTAQAEAEGTDFLLQRQNYQIEKAMNSTMKRIVVDLEKQAQQGDFLASALLLAMSVFRTSHMSIGPKGSSFSL